ncbi:hypothetical protein ACTJI8_12810 [Microbacterium sp. 22303]|uniref:hypothetical protein n=1 Tax=Microbacterium sp. 22303 TaxID=3453905 RepID=UPI003F828A67
MAARTTTNTTAPAVEYDFDNWTDEDEKKAVAALRPDVRYIIVENRFIGRFVDHSIVEVPFNLSVDDIDEMEKVAVGDPIGQLKHLLTKLGGEKVAKAFTAHDIAETMILATKYFDLLTRRASASLPE